MDAETTLAYQTVAARRLQWDNLVWQVPLITLTAQAFLFSVALASDTSSFARTVAASLSIVVTCLCMSLMARHRQAEVTDAHWLERREGGLKPRLRIHGEPWRKRRNKELPDPDRPWNAVPLWRGYRAWLLGLLAFAAAAVLIIVVTWTAPQLLTGAVPSDSAISGTMVDPPGLEPGTH